MDFLNGTWVKKYRRSLLVAAGLVGAGVVMYYGVRSLSLTAQARVEKDAARSLLLQKEAEDRAEAQYAQFAFASDPFLCPILDVMLLTLFWRFRVDDLNT
jgi:hypothetical protein